MPELPGYVLEALLGTGASATVWRGTQVETGQAVAVKILNEKVVDITYLSAEVERLARITGHPNVVTLIDARLAHHPPFLVTPLLSASLEGKRPDAEQAWIWLEQMVEALDSMHRKGILHCDLKPANVLLHEDNDVRIVDFGQSQNVGSNDALALGTLWYMPPEQALLPPEADSMPVPDVGWDIYALGATLYELVTGTLPRRTEQNADELKETQGDILAQLALYRKRLLATPLAPARGVDPDLARIIEHCLELDPKKRYPSMAAIREDMERAKEGQPLAAVPNTLAYVFARFWKRHPALVVSFAVATLLLMVQAFTRVHDITTDVKSQLLDSLRVETKAFNAFEQEHLKALALELRSGALDPGVKVVQSSGTGSMAAWAPVVQVTHGAAQATGCCSDGTTIYDVAATPRDVACDPWTPGRVQQLHTILNSDVTLTQQGKLLLSTLPREDALAVVGSAGIVPITGGKHAAALTSTFGADMTVTLSTPIGPTLGPIYEIGWSYLFTTLLTLFLALVLVGLAIWRAVRIRQR